METTLKVSLFARESTMSIKKYITPDELLLNSFKLAKKVHESGFRPDFLVGVWRGGAPVGIAVQEYLAYRGNPTDHIAIRTSSYVGVDQQGKVVKVYGLNYVVDTIRDGHTEDESAEGMKILLVDDVFDSGRSIDAVLQKIRDDVGDVDCTIKVACPWYKPTRNVSKIVPDFYVHETDEWLVFPHELEDMTLEEISSVRGPEIAALFD